MNQATIIFSHPEIGSADGLSGGDERRTIAGRQQACPTPRDFWRMDPHPQREAKIIRIR